MQKRRIRRSYRYYYFGSVVSVCDFSHVNWLIYCLNKGVNEGRGSDGDISDGDLKR